MADEPFIPVKTGQANMRAYSKIQQRLTLKERDTLRPFCNTCLRWDFNSGQQKPEDDYFAHMELLGKQPVRNPKKTQETIGYNLDYQCVDGHKKTLYLDADEIKVFEAKNTDEKRAK